MVIGKFCGLVPGSSGRVGIATDNILAGNKLYQLAEQHPDRMKMEEVKPGALESVFYDAFEFVCVKQVVLFSAPAEWADNLLSLCRKTIEGQIENDVNGKHHIGFTPWSACFAWENYGYSGTWGI